MRPSTMSFQTKTIAFALAAATLAAPIPAWAFGSAGCSDLPEYYRAQGALQGMTGACDMSIERARSIVAAYDGPAAVYGPAPPRHVRRAHRDHAAQY